MNIYVTVNPIAAVSVTVGAGELASVMLEQHKGAVSPHPQFEAILSDMVAAEVAAQLPAAIASITRASLGLAMTDTPLFASIMFKNVLNETVRLYADADNNIGVDPDV